MKTFGELLFALGLLFLAGNTAHKMIYRSMKKEAVEKVSSGLGSLETFSRKLTKK